MISGWSFSISFSQDIISKENYQFKYDKYKVAQQA